jgi:GTP-binding protein EngB required for normal cell division
MHISITRVFLECMIAYHLNSYEQAKKVLIHYADKVSVKNKKTLKMILERLELSDNDSQKEYFKLLSDSL